MIAGADAGAERFTSAEISYEQMDYLLRTNPKFFISYFMGEELPPESQVPDFHEELFSLMISTQAEMFGCAVPRGHAKTTLAKLACVWFLLFTDFRFIIYVSSTAPVAKEALIDVCSFFDSPEFQNVYGVVRWITRSETNGIYKFEITRNGVTKLCLMRALGAGQQVRGVNIDHQRPQLAIVDDLEDNDNTATEYLQDKLKRWYFGAFLKCLQQNKNKIIHIGNLLGTKTILNLICESNSWSSVRYGCIKTDGTPLWPELWTMEKLKADFLKYCEAGMTDVWFAEMMNMAISSGNGLITASDIKYGVDVTEASDIEYGFITIDPAISKKRWAHKTAIAVHGYLGGFWQVVEIHAEAGMAPLDILRVSVYLATKWQIRYVGIESVAYQAALQTLFPYILEMQGMGDLLTFVPLNAGTNTKTQRLALWASAIRDGLYRMAPSMFMMVEQLLSYNPKREENDDDVIDAGAYGPQMIEKYARYITQRISLKPLPEAAGSLETVRF